ncbi:threonine aldolase family protein [Lysobacter capsici]|uniref:threonine aldolase family protein n=1 Tax=Lysobacter capsici TaxID=435897 RepID=UPI000AE949CD|nr:beta-eliminating lyase-related protein [Lysobacter capsici]
MDRRGFFALGGWAAAMPMLAHLGPAQARADAPRAGSRRVDFTSDGLGLDPGEYASLLHDTVASGAVGADYYSNGGIVAELERSFAHMLGKQAAIFLPTGTLANQIAIRKLAGNDRRVLVQAESHLYNDSGDCAEVLSGLNLIPLAPGRASFELSQVRDWVERSAGGRVAMKVGAISIENPVRRMDHRMFEFAELERISAYAREQGIRLHLDGARLFNLPLHSGKSVREHTALFDTVYVSLWKHFNAASGAILAGDAAFIDGLYHTRRMFGGSLPQAWPEVALVPRYAPGFEADYANAWRVAEQLIALLQADPRFTAQRIADGTCRFVLKVAGVQPTVLAERAAKRRVILPRAHPGSGDMPMQVNPTLLRVPAAQLARWLIEAANG